MQDIIPQDDTPQKRCTGPCGRLLPATHENFHAQEKGKYGVRSTCRECRKMETPPDEKKAYNKWYYDTHIEQENQRCHNYYNTHTDETKLYRNEHAEEHNQAGLRHYRKHTQDYYARNHTRRARQKAAPGKFSTQDIQSQLIRQKGKCYWCGKKLSKYHIDHIVPLTRGGSNHPSNIVLACPHCNVSRNNKLPHEWPEGGRLL